MSQNEQVNTGQNGSADLPIPDPEVRPKAKHRHFSPEYKQRILDEADACRKPGELGALLRREGLYSSLLTKWRQQRTRAARAAFAPQRRGPKPDPLADEIVRLRRENERLQERLKQAETIIEVQKKISQLLGSPAAPTAGNGQT